MERKDNGGGKKQGGKPSRSQRQVLSSVNRETQQRNALLEVQVHEFSRRLQETEAENQRVQAQMAGATAEIHALRSEVQRLERRLDESEEEAEIAQWDSWAQIAAIEAAAREELQKERQRHARELRQAKKQKGKDSGSGDKDKKA